MPAIGSQAKLITTTQAAELLHVDRRTILNWIDAEKIPFLQLPSSSSRREFRIPLNGLLASLSGTYDLAAELADLDERLAEVSEEDVARALDASD